MFRPCSRVGRPMLRKTFSGIPLRLTRKDGPIPAHLLLFLYFPSSLFAVDLLFARSHCARPFQIDDGEEKRVSLFLVWFTVIFSFFSLSKSKRDLYLLPVFPAVSLMVGKFWDDFISHPLDRYWRRWIIFPLFGIVGFGLIAGVALPYVASIKFPSYLPYILPVAIMSAGCSIAILIFCRQKL